MNEFMNPRLLHSAAPHAMPDALIAQRAGVQHGVVSAPQLRLIGIDKFAVEARVHRGTLHVVYPGVYAVGHTGLSRKGQMVAAMLAVREDALVARMCAAELWGMIGYQARRLEILTPGHTHTTIDAVVRRTTTLHEEDIAVIDGIRVTSVARTCTDLAAYTQPHRLAKMMHEAEYLGILDLDALYRCAERNRTKRGYWSLLEAVALRRSKSTGFRSRFEAVLLRACRQAGLPEPLVNVPAEIAGQVLELDFHWPDAKVCVEADGPAHARARCVIADEERDRLLRAAGYEVLRITPARFKREREAFLDELRRRLLGDRRIQSAG